MQERDTGKVKRRRALWGGVIAVLIIITALVVVLPPSDGVNNSSTGGNNSSTPPWAGKSAPKVSFVVPTNVQRNTNFSATVNIGEVIGLWGTQFDIQYNPDILTFVNYSYGAVNGTPPDDMMVYKVGSGPDGEGILRVLSKWDEYSDTNNGVGVNGSGYICRLWFHAANKSGTTGLGFPVGKGDPPGERKIMQMWNGTVYGLDIQISTTVHVLPPGATPTPTSTGQ